MNLVGVTLSSRHLSPYDLEAKFGNETSLIKQLMVSWKESLDDSRFSRLGIKAHTQRTVEAYRWFL